MAHSPERLALLKKMLAQKGIQQQQGPAIPRRTPSEDGLAPVSFGQRRLWFEEQLEPGTSLYNDSLCVTLQGADLDLDRFDAALQEVVARHEVLRTTFESVDGDPRQKIHPTGHLPLRRVDLSDRPVEEQDAALEALLLEDVRGPFDLTSLPLVRGTLVRRGPTAFEFALTMHHIVSDGVSYAVLWKELGERYAAAEPEASLAPLSVQYADYAAWERARMDDARLAEGVAFWKRELGTERPEVELPADFPRPASAQHRGAFHRFRFPDALVAQLEAFCRREQLTSNWVLLAAYYTLLHSYSGQHDLTVGMPSSTRSERELEHVIGFFVQTMLLRNDLSGDPSFRELIDRTRRKALEMSRYEDIPFDAIVRAIRPAGTAPGAAPMIQAWIAPMKDLMPKLELPGMQADYRIVDPKNARFDVCLILDETSEGIEAYFEYDVDLFRAETIQNLAARYQALLHQVLEHPDTPLSAARETLERALPRSTERKQAAARKGPKTIKKVRRRIAGS